MDWNLIAILVMVLHIHWVADFLCQNDWMALNKSTDMAPLVAHCAIYSAITAIGIMVVTMNWHPCCWMIGFLSLFITHIGIDASTSRLASHYWKTEQRAKFFNTIGFDQFLHVSIVIILVFISKYKVAT